MLATKNESLADQVRRMRSELRLTNAQCVKLVTALQKCRELIAQHAGQDGAEMIEQIDELLSWKAE